MDDAPPATRTLKSQPALSPGSRFADRYVIVEQLGTGGMGRVFRVRDEKLGEEVVLKLIRADIASDPSVIARFRHELITTRRIGHPHVARTFDLGEEDGLHFIAMEYVRGEDLKKLMRKVGRMSAAQAAAVGRQIAEGLAEAHRLGVVHRDLKPQNIMIDENGHVKIVDFGIARSARSDSLTGPGAMVGTPEYMSPEQADGERVDFRSDLYALGVILYEMVTGEPPFSGNTPVAVALKHKTLPPPDPRASAPEIPESLSGLILRLLAKTPGDRPAFASDVATELARMKGGLSQPTPFPVGRGGSARGRRRVPAVTIAVLGVALIALVATGVLRFDRGSPPPAPGDRSAATDWDSSIAVLPFRDQSPRKDQEHISFGMTEALSDRLSRIGRLKVSSPTSVMRYRDTDKDIKTIGQELGVAKIVEGSLQIAKGRIMIRGRLTDASTGFMLWSDSYEGEMEDIFALQDEVSLSIAQALSLELAIGPEGHGGFRKPSSLAAYDAYTRGMNFFASRFMYSLEGRDLEVAADMIRQAVEIDPEYADAYAGLSWIYFIDFMGRGIPEHRTRGDEYAEKAYRLNPQSGLANILRGGTFFLSGDYDTAYGLMKTGLGLNPNQEESQFMAGAFLRQLGLAEQAAPHLEKTLALNPFFPLAHAALGISRAMSGHYDDVVPHFRTEKENNPRLPSGPLLEILLSIGEREEAESYFEQAEQTAPDQAELDYERSLIHAARGEKPRALAGPTSVYVFALLRMKEETLDLLEARIARSDRAFSYPYLKLPVFGFLRDDPRFQKLLSARKTLHEDRLRKYGDL